MATKTLSNHQPGTYCVIQNCSDISIIIKRVAPNTYILATWYQGKRREIQLLRTQFTVVAFDRPWNKTN